MEKFTIAIDGPAGAGKSTIAKIISKSLNILYLDTGAMYRAVALKALKEGINTKDRRMISDMVRDINIKICYMNSEQRIYLDNIDVTNDIRTPEVSIGASDVSAFPEVRIKMVELQRQIAARDSVVMEGRDIGTFVLPDANYKFFLNASAEERARRRYLEDLRKGIKGISFEDVKKDIIYRDMNDSTRDFAPFRKAEDAIEIDTTGMTIEEVAEKVLSYIRCF